MYFSHRGAHLTYRLPRSQDLSSTLHLHATSIVCTQEHEDCERYYLARQPCNHDVDAGLITTICHGSTSGLKDQRENIAYNEDDGISSRLETSEVFAGDDDETGKTEVNGGAQKTWGYGEANKIPG